MICGTVLSNKIYDTTKKPSANNTYILLLKSHCTRLGGCTCVLILLPYILIGSLKKSVVFNLESVHFISKKVSK